MYFGRGETLTTLKAGTPFFDGLEVGVSDPKWPHDLTLVLGVQDGGPVLNSVTVSRRRGSSGAYTGSLTSKNLRIALDRTFKSACERAAWQATRLKDLADEEDAAAARAAVGRRRQGRGSDFLKQVIEIARQNPEAPTRAVSERLYMSHRSATRWIATARKWFPEDKETK